MGEPGSGGGEEITAVGLNGAFVSSISGIHKVRNKNRGEDADNRDYDQQLDEGEALRLLVAHDCAPSGAARGIKSMDEGPLAWLVLHRLCPCCKNFSKPL